MNGKCVHRAGQFRRERGINHAMTVDPALPFKRGRHDMYPEMSLAAWPMAGMAFMQVRFVDDFEAFRQESFAQFVYDSVPCAHGRGITSVAAFRQWRETQGIAMSSLEAVRIA
jgi:hypothetical protein